MFLFKKKHRGNRLCALTIEPEGVCLATVNHGNTEKPVLEACNFEALAPGQEPSALLKKTVAEQRLDKTPCSTLLEIGDYHLLMVEAPEVPATELKAAIRWRIKDLIDFHIDDAVLDVFDVPPSGARGVQEHIYVVVTRSSVVKARIESLQAAGAELEVIDIPELAMRNLAARLEQDANGQAMLFFEAGRGLITLTRDATLYLARSVDIGYEQLYSNPDLVDRLALELQRSMDYYDRHFQQAPISHVSLCPIPERIEHLAERLEQQIGITVRELLVDDLVEVSAPIDNNRFAHCILSIGAALRTEATEL